MADLSQTEANVSYAGTVAQLGVAGEALGKGKPAYLSSGKWYATDADDTAKDQLHGITVSKADNADDPVLVVRTVGEVVDIGATTAKGAVYYASDGGGWAPVADVTTNWQVLPGLSARDTAGNCEFLNYTPSTDIIL